ncbi:hypothetical protein NG796_14910 [Laspinema sp. A4]|uniref:hypothetical protein n=1 Tax=Laspinema sp. D2d TaxID=2953686 RepID=UPI0021BAD8A9|nr:hypothetical protein [Laspinema sp. D2d]MCT7984587.1 hypothetical protein [Laspinema sp. D2d]
MCQGLIVRSPAFPCGSLGNAQVYRQTLTQIGDKLEAIAPKTWGCSNQFRE